MPVKIIPRILTVDQDDAHQCDEHECIRSENVEQTFIPKKEKKSKKLVNPADFDCLIELTRLAKKQKKRVKALSKFEKENNVINSKASEEIKSFSSILAAIADMQFKTGIMTIVPKAQQISLTLNTEEKARIIEASEAGEETAIATKEALAALGFLIDADVLSDVSASDV